MPVTINGQAYYRTAEVCLMVGIAKSTLLRWIRQGTVREAERRDRKGWRLFTKHEIEGLKEEAGRIAESDENRQ